MLYIASVLDGPHGHSPEVIGIYDSLDKAIEEIEIIKVKRKGSFIGRRDPYIVHELELNKTYDGGEYKVVYNSEVY